MLFFASSPFPTSAMSIQTFRCRSKSRNENKSERFRVIHHTTIQPSIQFLPFIELKQFLIIWKTFPINEHSFPTLSSAIQQARGTFRRCVRNEWIYPSVYFWESPIYMVLPTKTSELTSFINFPFKCHKSFVFSWWLNVTVLIPSPLSSYFLHHNQLL